ncbi:MAG: ABC transporter permease [Firmicutes bacterium]|nr:ABC transporter permease [Bacillota bacterium]
MRVKLRQPVEQIGVPRLIIAAFLVVLFVVAYVTNMSVSQLVSDSLIRVGMNGVLVLAMVPTISCGVGLNFGLPLGIICGLVGSLISMEMNLRGFAGFFAAIGCAVPLAVLVGYAYARLLESVRGQEMMVGTYAGFSVVALMCIFWLMAPFKNPALIWAIGGKGLRYTLTLSNHFGKVLNNFLVFRVFGVSISGGLLGFFLLLCLLVHLFFRSKLGIAMLAAGTNPLFARSAGIDVRRMKAAGVTISTVLGAIGIIVYAQSYGFLQLYLAPLMMAFPAVASILIGGARLQRATISNVIVGTVLFQTLLTIALPVTSRVIQGDISEVARLIISNGMILYALTRATGGK